MVKVDGCELCDEYEVCLHDVAVNTFVKSKTFRDEWKTTYQSMMPSKVLDFLRTYEKELRETKEVDRFDSHKLRVCIFINALNTYPGKKVSNTLRNSLIKEVKEAIDFIPALRTQLSDDAVKTLTGLTDSQKSIQDLHQQEETVLHLLKTSKALRANPQTNLMARYEINREFSELLREEQYASPQVAEYFLEEAKDWHELSRISEAKEWIEIAKLIFDRLDWPQEVEKCARIIANLNNLSSE